MLFGYDISWLPPIATAVGALAALGAAILAYRNVTPQIEAQRNQQSVALAAQREQQAAVLAEQGRQTDLRWQREQEVRYGVQRLDAYRDFSFFSDGLGYIGLVRRQGLVLEQMAGYDYAALVRGYAHAIGMIDLLNQSADEMHIVYRDRYVVFIGALV